MRVLLCKSYTARDGRALDPDQLGELPDDEAAALIAAGAAIAQADAPRLRLVRDRMIGGALQPAGWRGAVSPATADRAMREGAGVRLPPKSAADPEFPTLPHTWRGSPREWERLIAEDPEVRAYDALPTAFRPPPFALPAVLRSDGTAWQIGVPSDPPPSLRERFARFNADTGIDPAFPFGFVDASRQPSWPVRAEVFREPAPNPFAYWRTERVNQMLALIWCRLRSGAWIAKGVVIHGWERLEKEIVRDWWGDPHELNLRHCEFRPRLRANRRPGPELPTFSKLEIAPASADAAESSPCEQPDASIEGGGLAANESSPSASPPKRACRQRRNANARPEKVNQVAERVYRDHLERTGTPLDYDSAETAITKETRASKEMVRAAIRAVSDELKNPPNRPPKSGDRSPP